MADIEGAGPVHLDALGPGGPYRTRMPGAVTDVSGAEVALLSLVPPVYVDRALAALRRAEAVPVADVDSLLGAAAEEFATGTVGGLGVRAYEHLVSRTSGTPLTVVRAATRGTARFVALARSSAEQGRPRGTVAGRRDPASGAGRAVWARRGEVFAVSASGNHPGVHRLWLEALALGYRVAVRPSRREPFTPHRLVAALHRAGVRQDQLVLLPTDHHTAGTLIRGADRTVVYGGDEVVARYARDPRVLPQGPGRSKILVTADTDWREHLDTIVGSVADEGGTACVNATAVLVEGDPAPLAEAVAARLSSLPGLPPQDVRAVLPVVPLDRARALDSYLRSVAAGTRAWLGGDGIVDDLGDGSAVLRPAVHQVASAGAAQLRTELPFPCVWVAPWSRADGIAPLRDTLVLSALTRDRALLDALLAEPTVANLHTGDHPTYWMAPGVPHDSYLSDFLMRGKAVVGAL
ncbi:aldehyde dehydrogenase family protein [Streptomyces acidiscabies]|uniref:Aldehyde dehydrogenase family protein n=2 Tax=Streptomyces acidiscabies TaxID=42234 RepID=A0AAP6BEY3_9ACTN|nr:aldehyde dehydrogenase family protein [Streptomyces acidiscabies]MBP5942105.1 aldehyde dehydrogenase family protein [Streptomyces sp. LBUM 1476]MBZ3913608.1 aldehyde dehydrogenase family protein [Streptomyces acidiscabies]MDX2963444.1 aldehyde dehydrogenase family protein [Streptomyces acidiscabies]MDX3023178.1 aldehyde dehydrogenase family protein [Streptomyces acidiscabies]MDX3792676.1 aldehyde dehydrogenase family protein [Streptomyces acidiscabies]